MGYKHIRIILLSFTCWDLTFVLSLSYGLAPRELCWHLWDSCLPLPTAYTLSQVQIFPLAKEKTRNKNKTKNKANNKIQPRNLSSWKALSALWGLELLATEISKDRSWGHSAKSEKDIYAFCVSLYNFTYMKHFIPIMLFYITKNIPTSTFSQNLLYFFILLGNNKALSFSCT